MKKSFSQYLDFPFEVLNFIRELGYEEVLAIVR